MADKNIKVIHQFLLDHDFGNTAEALIQEASRMGFQNLENCKLENVTDPYNQLMIYYNTGDHSTFFQLWNGLFSDNVKQCEEYKKLTFYLHVHFAVLPKRKLHTDRYKEHDLTSETSTLRLSPIEDCATTENNFALEKCKQNNATEIEKNINDSMKQFQDYLRGNGKELEHDTELQLFYTLPFIEDLYTDTFFSKVLEQHWSDEMSKNLDSFITRHRQDLINLDILDNINSNKMQSQNVERVHTIMPATETLAVESDVTQNKTIKNNLPIMPNDRDIPIFLEDHEEQYNCSNKISLKSKSTQTPITGSQIIVNNSREYILNPGESVNSLSKMHKSDKMLIQYHDLALTKSHLYSVRTNYEKLKMRFHKLHADYHKLIDVAGELTTALENSVKGQNIDVQRTLEICMKIFPDLFNQNIRENTYPSLLQLDRVDVKSPPKLNVATVPISPKLLNYKKIKLHLINGDVKTKLLLLQALRWKLTLMQPTEQDEVLHEYINRDLLGLHGQIATDDGKSILPCLLTAGEAYARHLLQQFIARLLNTLASFRCGRDYLSVGSTIVNVVCFYLNRRCNDVTVNCFLQACRKSWSINKD